MVFKPSPFKESDNGEVQVFAIGLKSNRDNVIINLIISSNKNKGILNLYILANLTKSIYIKKN